MSGRRRQDQLETMLTALYSLLTDELNRFQHCLIVNIALAIQNPYFSEDLSRKRSMTPSLGLKTSLHLTAQISNMCLHKLRFLPISFRPQLLHHCSEYVGAFDADMDRVLVSILRLR